MPDACTLPTVERPLRLAEFDDLFAAAVRATDGSDPSRLRLELEPDPSVASRAADLAARETGCCAFLTFTLRIGDGRLVLDVTAGPEYADVLVALAQRATALSAHRA